LVSPLEGFSHGAIEIINEIKDAIFQLRNTCETGTSEQLTDEEAKPDFNLFLRECPSGLTLTAVVLVSVLFSWMEGGASLGKVLSSDHDLSINSRRIRAEVY
jgi:hypothetical protein